jgi:hypothetical protein
MSWLGGNDHVALPHRTVDVRATLSRRYDGTSSRGMGARRPAGNRDTVAVTRPESQMKLCAYWVGLPAIASRAEGRGKTGRASSARALHSTSLDDLEPPRRRRFQLISRSPIYVFTIPIQVFTDPGVHVAPMLAFTFDQSECSPWTETRTRHPCAHLDPANAITYYSILDPRIRTGPQTRQLTEEDGAWRSST